MTYEKMTFGFAALVLLCAPSLGYARTMVGTRAIGADIGFGPRYAGGGIAGFSQWGHHRANLGLGVGSPFFSVSYSFIFGGFGRYDQFLPMIEFGYGSAGMDRECTGGGFFDEHRECRVLTDHHGPFVHLTGELWLTKPDEDFGFTFRFGGGFSFQATDGFDPHPTTHGAIPFLGIASYL